MPLYPTPTVTSIETNQSQDTTWPTSVEETSRCGKKKEDFWGHLGVVSRLAPGPRYDRNVIDEVHLATVGRHSPPSMSSLESASYGAPASMRT